MMRAIIALAVVLALAVASKTSGPRGNDLRAAPTTSEVTVAKKAPSRPVTGESEDSGELDENPFPEGGMEDDSPPPDEVECQVLDLMIRTKQKARVGPLGSDERSAREMQVHIIITALHRALMLGDDQELAAVTKNARNYLSAHPAPPFDGTNILTPKEFFAHLVAHVPSIVGQSGQPIEKTCDRLASLIRRGRAVSEDVAKLSADDLRANLLRALTANPLQLDAAPDDLVKAVLRAAGLSRDYVNNRLDSAGRMRKTRAAAKEQLAVEKAPGGSSPSRRSRGTS